MKRIAAYILSLLGLSASPSIADSVEFIWKPDRIKAEILADNTYLKIGKYLQLTQELDAGESGWRKSKIDIPNTWHIKSVHLDGNELILDVQDIGQFAINPSNYGELTFSILDGGTKTDTELDRIWNHHAKK